MSFCTSDAKLMVKPVLLLSLLSCFEGMRNGKQVNKS